MRIIWSPQAHRDLDDLFDYILEDNPTAAVSVYKRVKEQVETLGTHPHLGRPGRIAGTRELVIPNTPYIVPYRVRHNTVEIIRVYHSTRRWPDSCD